MTANNSTAREISRKGFGMTQFRKTRIAAAVAAAMMVAPTGAMAASTIVFDGTTGGKTLGDAVAPTGTTYTISQADGTSSTGGAVVFHSFQDFQVGTGDTADFTTTTATNVLSRVTGLQPNATLAPTASVIDGTISTGAGVSFWLVNPAGVVVGDNATINVGGDLSLGSADGIMTDVGDFSAIDPLGVMVPLATTAPVSFGFTMLMGATRRPPLAR